MAQRSQKPWITILQTNYIRPTLIFHLNFFLLPPSAEVGDLSEPVAVFQESFLSPITEIERGKRSTSECSIF